MAKSADLPGVEPSGVDPVILASLTRQEAALSRALDAIKLELDNLMRASEPVRAAMVSRISYLRSRSSKIHRERSAILDAISSL